MKTYVFYNPITEKTEVILSMMEREAWALLARKYGNTEYWIIKR